MQFRPGELFAGKYRIASTLGAGGMGVVLAARHEALAQEVAIKVLHASGNEKSEIKSRFLREARLAASFRSIHIAKVHDVGTLPDGEPFMVMEKLDGEDLSQLLDRAKPLSITSVVDYVIQACEAIAEAHAAGVVHRDLKPSNLFLTHAPSGAPLVKVLDFGISKVDTELEPRLTKTSDVIGSPMYMSPEQLRSSRNVNTGTDIWALGVILYELLTAHLPFDGESMSDLTIKIATEPPAPLRTLRPDVPESLEAVVLKCLAKDSKDRYRTIVDLVAALEPFSLPITSPSDRAQRLTEPRDRDRKVEAALSSTMALAETQLLVVPAPAKSRRTALVVAVGGAAVASAALAISFGHGGAPRDDLAPPPSVSALPPTPATTAVEPPVRLSPMPAPSPEPESLPKPAPSMSSRAPVVAPVARPAPRPAPSTHDEFQDLGRH